jgi:hypothetical protein
MKPIVQLPPPPVSLVEEWDNPAMAEFKRQEAEDRVTFAQSKTQEEWRELVMADPTRDQPIRLAPASPKKFRERVIHLPW